MKTKKGWQRKLPPFFLCNKLRVLTDVKGFGKSHVVNRVGMPVDLNQPLRHRIGHR